MFPFPRHLLACVAVLLVFAGFARADEESEVPVFPRSLPANPWVHQPPLPEATLVIMLTINEAGQYLPPKLRASEFAREHFNVAPPAKVVLVDYWLLDRVIRQICEFNREDIRKHGPSHLEMVQRFYRATHVVETIAVERDGGTLVRARMVTPKRRAAKAESRSRHSRARAHGDAGWGIHR